MLEASDAGRTGQLLLSLWEIFVVFCENKSKSSVNKVFTLYSDPSTTLEEDPAQLCCTDIYFLE